MHSFHAMTFGHAQRSEWYFLLTSHNLYYGHMKSHLWPCHIKDNHSFTPCLWTCFFGLNPSILGHLKSKTVISDVEVIMKKIDLATSNIEFE